MVKPALDRGLSRTPLTGGGGRITPHFNSQTNECIETGEAAIEKSRQDTSKARLIFCNRARIRLRSRQRSKLSIFTIRFTQPPTELKLGRNTIKG